MEKLDQRQRSLLVNAAANLKTATYLLDQFLDSKRETDSYHDDICLIQRVNTENQEKLIKISAGKS